MSRAKVSNSKLFLRTPSTLCIYILLTLFFSSGCSKDSSDHVFLGKNINVDIFIKYLEDPLWSGRDAYDAGHNLMIPLHWAFFAKNKQLKKSFDDHFEKMLASYAADEIALDTLTELQYLTLASRYLVLVSNGSHDKIRSRLADLVLSRFEYYWQEKPAWQWARDAFKGGIKERILWKLEENNPERSYYNMFFDQEFFVIGIAADLLTYSGKNDEALEHCREAVELFSKMMEQRLDTGGMGWKFQAGTYRDRPEFAYSGYLTQPAQDAPPIVAEAFALATVTYCH